MHVLEWEWVKSATLCSIYPYYIFLSGNFLRKWDVWSRISVILEIIASFRIHLSAGDITIWISEYFIRSHFPCWFNVNCVLFHCQKTHFILVCNTSANSASSVTLYFVERLKATIPFYIAAIFLFRRILQQAKATITKQLRNNL